jgi:hypothetical protein
MRQAIFMFFLAAACLAEGLDAGIPPSNNRLSKSDKLTTYWTVDTTKVYQVSIHLNSVTLFQFPARVKFVAVGNTAEISTTVDNHCVYVKPLLGMTHSNMIVTLYSGEIITVDIRTEKHGRRTERVVFFYPDHNPMKELAEKISASYEQKRAQSESNLRDELLRTIPEESVKDLLLYRIKKSRKSTTVRNRGYLISFDGLVSTKRFTYFLFSTNAAKNPECPIMTVKSIEVKSKGRSKAPVELEEVLNTADRIIFRTPILSENVRKTKLFISLKIYEEIEKLKVTAF